MRVASIHQPVQEELAQVEATLQAVKRVELPWLEEMLDHILAGDGAPFTSLHPDADDDDAHGYIIAHRNGTECAFPRDGFSF